jgi:hypothetical protein
VPDMLLRGPGEGERLLEHLAQRSHPVGESAWLEKVRPGIPSADEVWVLVLVRASWSVEVAKKPSDATASEDLPDHVTSGLSQLTKATTFVNCRGDDVGTCRCRTPSPSSAGEGIVGLIRKQRQTGLWSFNGLVAASIAGPPAHSPQSLGLTSARGRARRVVSWS